MKTKVILFLVISAVLTLSFTFASVKNFSEKKSTTVNSTVTTDAPAGGFLVEDKL
jgi:hypothetical protein